MSVRQMVLYLAMAFLAFPITNANAADASMVEFRISCEKQEANCSKAIVKDTKEEIFVQTKPVLTLADISSATAGSGDNAPATIDYLVSHGAKKEDVQKIYWLTLAFKNPKALHEITSQNTGKRMAIFINNDLVTAPKILEPISDDKIKITGAHMKEEATSLADTITKAIQ